MTKKPKVAKAPGRPFKISLDQAHHFAWMMIDEHLEKTKRKEGETITSYDWGWRDGLVEARELFRIPTTAAGKDVTELHMKWVSDPKYKVAYDVDRIAEITKRFATRFSANDRPEPDPLSPGEAAASHARARERVEKALRSPPVQANLKKHKAKVLKKLKKKGPAK